MATKMQEISQRIRMATDQEDKKIDEQGWRNQFETEVRQTEQELPGNPASWVGDESKWEKAKEASKKSYGKINYPFVVWFYLNVLHGRKK